MKNLEKSNPKIEKDFADLVDAIEGDKNTQFNENLPMSLSEIDAIRSQIQRSWNTTAISATREMMKVVVLINLDMNGNVLNVRIIERDGTNNPQFQIFADSAVRAIHIASPIQNLDPNKYRTWQEMELAFDSSGMIS